MRKIIFSITFQVVLLLTVLTASAIAAEQSIPDVQENHWAYDAVQWVVDEGVVAGYPDGTFRPDQEVTEGEFLSLFIRSFEEFKTQDETEDWTDPLYKFAEEKGWPVRGSKPDTSARNKPVTREVVAEIIAAADGINLTGSAAVQYLLDKGYSQGKTSATIDGYAAEDTLKRSESVMFIQNIMESGMDVQTRPKESVLEIQSGGEPHHTPNPNQYVVRDNTYLYLEKMESVWELGLQYGYNPQGYVSWSSSQFPRYRFQFMNEETQIGVSFDPVSVGFRFSESDENQIVVGVVGHNNAPQFDVASMEINVSLFRNEEPSEDDYEYFIRIIEIFGVKFDSTTRNEFMDTPESVIVRG